MVAFYDSPRGEAYEWLIDFATERSEMFMVARGSSDLALRKYRSPFVS